jgi:hypothetical protein
MLESGFELSGMKRREAKVVVEVVTQLELTELGPVDQQEQRLERTIGLAQRPAEGKGRLGLGVGADDGPGPSRVGFAPPGRVLIAHGLPRPARQIEGLSQLRWGWVGKDEQRLHERVHLVSPVGQVALELELCHLALVLAPFRALVAQEPLEDVLSEGLTDQIALLHCLEGVVE